MPKKIIEYPDEFVHIKNENLVYALEVWFRGTRFKVTEPPAEQGCEGCVSWTGKWCDSSKVCSNKTPNNYQPKPTCPKCGQSLPKPQATPVVTSVPLVDSYSPTMDSVGTAHTTNDGKNIDYTELTTENVTPTTPVDISKIEVGDEVQVCKWSDWHRVIEIKGDDFTLSDGDIYDKTHITAHRKKEELWVCENAEDCPSCVFSYPHTQGPGVPVKCYNPVKAEVKK